MARRIWNCGLQITDLILKSVFICVYLWLISVAVFAQSGRIKPKETPTPERPRVIYNPTETREPIYPTVTPTPTTVSKKIDDDDIWLYYEYGLNFLES